MSPYKWLTADNSKVSISLMETRHLFYTLRLIWNNQHGKKYRWARGPIRPFKDPRYTDKYLTDVNYNMHEELLRRPDLTPWMRQQLDKLKELKLELLLDSP